ncbi:MAG: GNAT family N-acetyltransferase [Anaerolineae bacterium]
MPTVITQERPDTPDAVQLITELESILAPFYPTESRHGYSVDKLLRQGVAFFVMRHDGLPAGCGGVQLFGTAYGEVKRMFVRPQFRGKGLSKLMLEQLAAHCLRNGVTLLRLETGIHQTEAISLYERWGFQRISPFGDYHEDPLSVFYEKRLDS